MENNKFFYFSAFEHNCLRACWFNYLKLLGYQNPLLYIDASIRITDYMFQSYEQISNTGLYKRYQNKIYANYGSINQVWEDDIKILNQNIPLIFDVDVFYLPYRQEYKKNHGSHGIICKSCVNEKIEIIDWCKPYFYNDFISVHDVLKSRESCNPYDNNPYSGKPINSFSLAVVKQLGDRKVSHCICDWIQNTHIDLDYFDNIIFQLKNEIEVKKICDLGYLILSDIQFARFFLENIMFKDNEKLLDLLEIIISQVKLFNYLLLRYYLNPKTNYITKGLSVMYDIRGLLINFVDVLSHLEGEMDE